MFKPVIISDNYNSFTYDGTHYFITVDSNNGVLGYHLCIYFGPILERIMFDRFIEAASVEDVLNRVKSIIDPLIKAEKLERSVV